MAYMSYLVLGVLSLPVKGSSKNLHHIDILQKIRLVQTLDDVMVIRQNDPEVASILEILVRHMHSRLKINPKEIQR